MPPNPLGSALSDQPTLMPGLSTSQSGGTSKASPLVGLTTTFQPAITGWTWAPAPRGLAAGEDGAAGDEAAGDFLSLPSALVSLLPSSLRTTTPVTAAATTTAVAAMMAMRVVFFLSLFSGGCGGPGGLPTGYCGTVGCWYGFGVW